MGIVASDEDPVTVALRNSSIATACVLIAAAPFAFWISLLLTTPFVNGDQIAYRNFYDALFRAPLNEIAQLQFGNTGSAEPLFGLIMWLGANLEIDKDIYIAIWNTVLTFSVLRLTTSNRASLLFSALLLTNFYFVVLLTSAERLKFAYIALALAASSTRKWRSVVWCAVSIISHFQSLVILAALLSGFVGKLKLRAVLLKRNLIFVIPAIIPAIYLGARFFSVFQTQIIDKINAYLGAGNFSSVTDIAILLVVALACLPRKLEAFLMLLACAVASLALGEDRVNMIAFSLFIYFCIRDRRTSHPAVLALMLYFSFKTIGYVQLIFARGDGFGF